VKAMKFSIFLLKVVDKNKSGYVVEISDKIEYAKVIFNYETKDISFENDNDIVKLLKKNKYQLSKILRNKRENTYFDGFEVKIVIQDGKDIEAFNDENKIAVLDKLNGKYESYVIDKGKDDIYEVYTDGSYLEKIKSGGFCYIIKDPFGEYEMFQKSTDTKSSSLIELQAAIAAIKYLKDKKYIRIITDSQYVKKGLTEWVMVWRLNNWMTANGKNVKNKKYWIEFDELCDGKYIEFKWIKAHSKQFENSLCDIYAKEIASKKN
jgi:ribonuclease HI